MADGAELRARRELGHELERAFEKAAMEVRRAFDMAFAQNKTSHGITNDFIRDVERVATSVEEHISRFRERIRSKEAA